MSFLLSADQSILLDFLSELYIGYAEQCAAEDFIFYRLFLVSSFVGSDKTLLDWEKCMQNKVKCVRYWTENREEPRKCSKKLFFGWRF